MLRTHRREASLSVVIALAAALALAGCTPAASGVASLDGDPQAQQSSPPGGDDGDGGGGGDGDQVAFAECMREHGIDMPDPDTEDGGFAIAIPEGSDPDEVDAAMEACKEFMPNGGEMPKPNAEQLAQMREFSECMRDEGIEGFPDPSADGGLRIDSDMGFDPESDEFREAQEKCGESMPKPKGEDGGPATSEGGES
jgi:hypothetical protein